MLKIYGVPFSAHTRKVLIGVLEKRLEFELIPVVPLAPPAGWRDISPLGLIPVLEEICGYDHSRIRLLFEDQGMLIQEWDSVRTDWLTIRGGPALAGVAEAGLDADRKHRQRIRGGRPAAHPSR